jgi:hypothetical protein
LTTLTVAAALAFTFGVGLTFAKDDKDPPTRVVKGLVTDDAEYPIAAVVQLKNTKTLDVRSYHVSENGQFYFSGLDPNIDYEVKALSKGYQEKTRRVSSFDDSMELYYLFKLKKQ